MALFHQMRITDIRPETRNAVVLRLEPANGNMSDFNYAQGQYITFKRDFDGEEIRRSYSICSEVGAPFIEVGIKKVAGGLFSNWANESLKAGDLLEAMPPMGNFYTELKPSEGRHYLGFAGGSGITPFMSIIKTVLSREPQSRFTLVYGNVSANSIMFREELDDLKNLYMGRFNVLHILESDAMEVDLFHGRIDADKCKALFKNWIDLKSVDQAFICGPEPMMKVISESLEGAGLPKEKIKFELFASPKPTKAGGKLKQAAVEEAKADVDLNVTIDGVTRSVSMHRNDLSILEAGLAEGMDLPYACKGGVCASCKCKVVEGDVDMEANFALEDYEVEAGYVLSCQSYPVSDKVVVDYDQ
ncbi:MAG: 1,2-phenylacetyl-CoA epoxidase subunit PaaE [Alphaproteobacteria bacterium]|nr:1,2-phenylacetyl-CoA epoxidase subunit PaaE [Alphaproteobacteria bacterium]